MRDAKEVEAAARESGEGRGLTNSYTPYEGHEDLDEYVNGFVDGAEYADALIAALEKEKT